MITTIKAKLFLWFDIDLGFSEAELKRLHEKDKLKFASGCMDFATLVKVKTEELQELITEVQGLQEELQDLSKLYHEYLPYFQRAWERKGLEFEYFPDFNESIKMLNE